MATRVTPEGGSGGGEAEAPVRVRWVRWGVLAALIAAVVGGILGSGKWERSQALRLSRDLLARGDLGGAMLAAKQSVALAPDDPAALEGVVSVLERANSAEVLVWYPRWVAVARDPVPVLCAWASSALRFGETSVADGALAAVPESRRHDPGYLAVAGPLALKIGRPAEATAIFDRLLELAPSDVLARLNAAGARVASGGAGAAEGRASLVAMASGSSGARLEACRLLARLSAAGRDPAEGRRWAEAVLSLPGSRLGDHLFHLGLLQGAGAPEFGGRLEKVLDAARSKPGEAAEAMVWMNANGLAQRSAEWGAALPGSIAGFAPVQLARAEACELSGQWELLWSHVASGGWGALDFMRCAYFAKVRFEKAGGRWDADAEGWWRRSLAAAAGNPGAHWMLSTAGLRWGWGDRAEVLLWGLAARPWGQRNALKRLYAYYRQARDSRGLLRVSDRILAVDPADAVARNNAAQLRMLLGQEVERGRDEAAENAGKHPGEPAFQVTLAWAEHLGGATEKGLERIGRLPEAVVADPRVGVYRAAMLAAVGRGEEARQIAGRAREGLLPEEEALVAGVLGR